MTNWTFQNHQKKSDTFHSCSNYNNVERDNLERNLQKINTENPKIDENPISPSKIAHCGLATRKIAILIFKMHFGPIFCLSRTIKN